MQNKKWLLNLLMILALVLGAAPAGAAELVGVHMDDTMSVGKNQLRLNGIALRTKYMFKIYVGALYLAQPMTRASEIIKSDTPKALVMQFLRDLKHDTLVEAYREGFANNAPALLAREQPDVDRFLAFLPAVKEGDRLTFTYEPGKGSTFRVGGAKTLTIPGKDFADLYLLVFIGPTPPTPELKKGLLGPGAQ